MEQESRKAGREHTQSLTSERFRCLVYFVATACVLSCIAFLSVSLVSMERRLGFVESKYNAISKELQELKRSRTGNSMEESLSAARHKRSANPTTSLSDLTKRVIAVEGRTVNLSNDLRMRTSLRGRDGRDGIPGPPGSAGRDGRDGREGPAGPRGITGPKGDVGRTGSTGPAGHPGPRGPKGQEGQGLSGVSYNRWGRTNCSGDATVVYTGLMGSDHYTHTGGGSNFLCLTNNPIYDKYESGFQDNAAIYSTEYQSGSFPGFKHNLDNHDAPCAVCYVKSRGSQMMIPATNKCPSGWTREYHGYLMTSHYNHAHSSEYVCVDLEAEVVPGTHANINGALLYMVQGTCGYGLPCKPYINGHELTCVVCTK